MVHDAPARHRVEPGAQPALAAIAVERLEHVPEDLLADVLGLVRRQAGAPAEGEDERRVPRDELALGLRVPRPAAGDERAIVAQAALVPLGRGSLGRACRRAI